MTTITLKEILTDDNLKAFFKHSSDFFSHYPKSHLHFIKTTLLAAKNWFKKFDIDAFGLIVAIHTFSRDSSFHPHFHVILSLGRYLMRPAIAEHRITKFENNEVTFWYIDVTTKDKIFLTLPLFKFISRLILHINPKGLKAVRRYGFYARNIKGTLKNKIKSFFKKSAIKNSLLTWRVTSFHHKKYGDFYYP